MCIRDRIKRHLGVQAIGHDKLNQLRHARFLEEGARLPEHMAAHGALSLIHIEMCIRDRPQAVGGTAVDRAYGELGKPYSWGAVGPDSYDCSGLVSYCLLGRHSRLGTAASFRGYTRVSNPKPGDICCNDHHCGIYIGDGQMIHAPRTGDVVKISAVHSGMIYTRY